MSRADGTSRSHTFVGWLLSLAVCTAGAAYVCTWWGDGLEYIRDWLPRSLADRWLGLQPMLDRCYRKAFVGWLGLQFLSAIVPVLLFMAFRRKPGDLGLGKFNILGWRLIAVSVLLSIPFGFLLIYTHPTGNLLPTTFRATMRMLAQLSLVIPEHALICGLLVALMLPERRLPQNIRLAPVTGSRGRRLLRWLGLAQPIENGRVLSWFGLTAESLYAVVASGVVFWLVHLGKKDVVEVILSLPGGVAVAYVTLRTRSIWPAVIAHCTMNLIPGGIAMLLR